jgi:hypothetical protein
MELSPAVIALLQEGKKIEAIKLLRQEHSLGLKEAKEVADNYCSAHPELIKSGPPPKFAAWILYIAVAGLVAYWFNHRS